MASLFPASSLVASFHSMKLAMVEVLTPWKLGNTINQGLFACFWSALVVKYLPAHYCSMEPRLQEARFSARKMAVELQVGT